ncbi:hypothetical protein GJ496_003759 [Pomphorhynchus laevis]|nr:hypothetical protein GJ496_003759 [Pomphorhynchus laevis]
MNEICYKYSLLRRIKKDIQMLYGELTDTVDSRCWRQVNGLLQNYGKKLYIQKVSRLKRKTTLLYEKGSARFSLPVDLDTPNCTLPCETPSSVVNLSNTILSDCEISALAKGLKFSVTKKSMTARDEIDITSELESLCSKLASNFSNNPVTGGVINRIIGMRIEMSHLKGKTLTPKTNISHAEKEAIRGLRDNTNDFTAQTLLI